MKIAVLMSGGIDSSFAALHLKKQGFDVFGVTFLQLGAEQQKEDLKRAKEVAKALSMPHFAIKIKDVFEKEIISPFCEVFKKGSTPNPCPFCNKKIKFGLVLKKAEKIGADYIATGHYARKKEIRENLCSNSYRFAILKAKDSLKDQSYFLWQLTQKELKRAIFPLGDFTKKEVFEKVKKLKIGKFFKEKDYSESQDICFLKNIDLKDFLRKKTKKRIGAILDKSGKKIGEHDGIQFFTIGQRGGIKIGAKSPNQKPLYVIEINADKNAIVVGKEQELYKKELLAKNINWISGKTPKLPLQIEAQIRYGAKPAVAIIKKYSNSALKVEFKKAQRAITPGQHVVFYQKNLLLGGGVIKAAGF